jgi:hypothetical protein
VEKKVKGIVLWKEEDKCEVNIKIRVDPLNLTQLDLLASSLTNPKYNSDLNLRNHN